MQKPLTSRETWVIRCSLRAFLKQCENYKNTCILDEEEQEVVNEKIEVIKDLLDNL